MHTTFPHHYPIRERTELPTSDPLPRYYYPGASREGGRDGLLLEIHPDAGAPWLGVFAFGHVSPKGVSGVFTTPNPHRLCVVARGGGYLVSADDPTSWEPVKATPVLDVRPVRAQRLLVFADYTEPMAYGEAGLRWRTGRLAWDGLTITEVTDKSIRGEFWDPPKGTTGTFSVDLETGAHTGGRPEF